MVCGVYCITFSKNFPPFNSKQNYVCTFWLSILSPYLLPMHVYRSRYVAYLLVRIPCVLSVSNYYTLVPVYLCVCVCVCKCVSMCVYVC